MRAARAEAANRLLYTHCLTGMYRCSMGWQFVWDVEGGGWRWGLWLRYDGD
jgi:hypothetical protein